MRQSVGSPAPSQSAQRPGGSASGIRSCTAASWPSAAVVTKANGKVREDPAFLVKIKKPEPSLLRTAQQPPELLAPPTVTPAAGTIGGQPAAPGSGRLKSIGDQ